MQIYAGNEQGEQVRLEVSRDELSELWARGKRGRGWLTDQVTGQHYYVRRAACELPGCMCSLAVVKVLPKAERVWQGGPLLVPFKATMPTNFN